MIVIYDLETLKNFFLYVDVSLNGDNFNVFEISKFKNDLIPLLTHLKTLKCQIGFNNLGFDSQVQQWIVKNQKKLQKLESELIANEIHDYVQQVIDKSNRNEWPDFWEKDLIVRQ